MATAVYRAQISAEMLGMTLSELKQLKDLLDNINNGKIKISGDTKNIKNVSQTIEKIKTLMGGIEDVQIGESVFDEGKINAQAHDISDGLEQIFKGQTIYLPMDCDQSELMGIHDRVQKVFEDKIPIRFELDMSIPNIMKELDDFSNEIGGDLKSKIESSTWGYTSSNIVDILKRTLGEKNILPTEKNLMNAIDKISSSIWDWDEKKFKSGEMHDPFKFSELLKKYKDMFALQTKLRREYQNYDTDVMDGFEDGVYFDKLKPKYMSYLEGRYRDYYQTILSFIRNFEDLRYGYIDRAVDEGYNANSQWYTNMVEVDDFDELQDSLDEKKEKINKLKQQLEVSKNMILELSNDQDELKKRYDDMQREFMDLFESDIKSDDGSSQANIENLEKFITSIGSLIEKLNTIIGDGDLTRLKSDVTSIISAIKDLFGISDMMDISENDLMNWGKNNDLIDSNFLKRLSQLSRSVSDHKSYLSLSKQSQEKYDSDYLESAISERYKSSGLELSYEDYREKELREYEEFTRVNNETIEKEINEIEKLEKEKKEMMDRLKKIYGKENNENFFDIVKEKLIGSSGKTDNSVNYLEQLFPNENEISRFKENINMLIEAFRSFFEAFGNLESNAGSNNIFGFIKSIKEILPELKEAIASVSMNIDLGNSFDDSSMGKIVERQENYLRAYRNQLQEMKRIKREMSKQSFGNAYKSNALESQVNKRLNTFNEDDYETFDDKIVAYKKLIEDMEAASLKTYGKNIYANMDKSFARKVSTAKGSITRQTNASEQKAKNRLANLFGANLESNISTNLNGIESKFNNLIIKIDELIVKVQMLSDAFMGLNNISLMPKIGEEGRFDVIRNNVEEFKKLVEEINIKNIDKFDDNPNSFTKYMNGSNELDYKLIPQNVKNIIDSISEELSIGRITLDEAIEKYKQSFNELFNIKDESSKSVNVTDDKNNINDANEKIAESEQEVANSYLGEAEASKELTSELEKLATAKTNLIIANNFYTGHKFDDVVKKEGDVAKYASKQFERLATAKGTVGKTTLAEAKKELDKEEKKSVREKAREEARKKALERNPYEGYDFVVYDYEDALNGDHNLGALLNRIGDSSFEKALTEVINKNIIDEKELGKITKVVDRNYINQRRDREGNAISVEDRYRTIYTENGSYQFKHVVPTEEQRKAYKEKYGEELTSGWIIQNTQDEIFNIESYTKATKQLISEEKKLLNLDKELANKNISQSDYDTQANIINRRIKELENVRDLVKSDMSSMPTISEMTKGIITDNDDLLKVIRNRNKEYRDNGFRTNQQVEKDNNKSLKENLKEYEKTSQNISRLQRSYMVDNAKYTNARLNGSATDTELKNMQLIMEVKRNVIEQEKEHLKIVGERIDDENEEKKRIDKERKTQLKLNQSNAKVVFESENNKTQTKSNREKNAISNKNNAEFEKQLNGIKAQEKLMKEAEKRYQDAKSSNSSTPEQIEQLKNSYEKQRDVLGKLSKEALDFAEASYGIVDGEQRIKDAIIEANSAFEKQQRLESDKQVAKDIKAQEKGQETDYKKSLQEYQRVSNKIVQINRQIENSKAKQKWGDDTGNYTLEEMSRLKEIEKKNKELLDIEEKKRSAIETRLKESKKYNEEEVNAIDNIREKQLDLNKKNAEYSFFDKNVGNQERSSKKTENAKLKSENKAEFERQLREIEHKQELINKLTQDIQNGEKTGLNKEVLGNWRNELESYEKDLEELKKNLIEFSNSAYGIEENVSDEIEKRIKKVNDKKLESENQQGRTDAIKDAKARKKQNISDYEKEVKNIESLYESYNSKIADLADKQLSGKLLNADFEKLSGKIKDLKKDIDEAKRNLRELEETGDIDDDLIRKSTESIEKARIAKRNLAKESIENSRKKYDEVAENKAREEREKARKQAEKQAQKDADSQQKLNLTKYNNELKKYKEASNEILSLDEKLKKNQARLASNETTKEMSDDMVSKIEEEIKSTERLIELRKEERKEALKNLVANENYNRNDTESIVKENMIKRKGNIAKIEEDFDKKIDDYYKKQANNSSEGKADRSEKVVANKLNAIAKQVKEVESLRESYNNAISLGLDGNKELGLLAQAEEKLGSLVNRLKEFAKESKYIDETDVINKIADTQKTARDEYDYDKQKRDAKKQQDEEARIARENTKKATDSFDKQIKDIQEQSKKIETLRDMYNNSILVNGRDSSRFEGGLLDKATEQLDEMIQKLREFAKESKGVLGFSNYEVNKRIGDAVISGQKDYVRQQEENAKKANKPYYQQALNNMKKYQEEYAELFKKLETETNENKKTDLIERMNALETKVASAREQAERFGSTLKSVVDVANDINNIFEKIDNSVARVTTESDKLDKRKANQLENLAKTGEIEDAVGFKNINYTNAKELVSNYLKSNNTGYSDLLKFKAENINDDGVINVGNGFAKFSGEVKNASGELVKFLITYDALNNKMTVSKMTEGLGLDNNFRENLIGSREEIERVIEDSGKLSSKINDFANRFKNSFSSDDMASEEFNKTVSKLKENFLGLADGLTLDGDGNNIEAFKERIKGLIKDLTEANNKYKTLAKQVKQENLESGNFRTEESVKQYLRDYVANNGKGSINGDFKVNRLNNGMTQVIGYARDFNNEVTKISANWSDLTGRMSISTTDMGKQFTGLSGWIQGLGKRFVSLSQYWVSMYLSPMDLMRYARTIISSITELDSAMIDLQKTAKMTGSELNQVYENSAKKASEFGITTQEYIQATADMSRAGFSTYEEATQMADATALFTAISPDVEASEASTGLVSILRAFDIETENIKDEVLSKINVIGKTIA